MKCKIMKCKYIHLINSERLTDAQVEDIFWNNAAWRLSVK